MAPQYAQKFRDEWLKDKNVKEWIVELENDNTKVRCRFCKCDIRTKKYDLNQHLKTKKHMETSKNFSASRALTKFIKPITTKTAQTEGAICLFIAAHSSILSCDHLGELCKKNFKSSEAADSLKLHRTKCTGIICNVLSPHFQNELKNKINNGPYSILIDESTDISVLKFLGITIMYYDTDMKQVTSSYLSLVEMESCDAEALTNAVKTTLHSKGLDIKNLCGIGTDNTSVMVGINNGVYVKLKQEIPSLIHIPCICHSLQLAVSAAAAETLPRNIDFLIRETYNWFSHSTLRQAQYKNLFKAINDGHDPLKIVKACATRWLSIETAVSRILTQWVELKTLFGIAKNSEKCYMADTLHAMYSDSNNLAYLKLLYPILEDIQKVNKSFESNTADPSKLLTDLTYMVRLIAKRFIKTHNVVSIH